MNFLEVTGATYDAYNRLATFNQTSHRVTAEAAGVVNGAFVFDEGKATLHEVTVTGRTEAVFDGKGALTGYKERTETRDGTGVAGDGRKRCGTTSSSIRWGRWWLTRRRSGRRRARI